MGIAKVVGGTVAGLGLVGAGYAGLGGLDLNRDDSGALTEAGELGAFRIRVGDCVIDFLDTSGDVESVQATPCTDSHEAEVYHAFNVPEGDGTYPGDDAIDTAAGEGCYGAFTGFVGMAYEKSVLDFTYLSPSAESWADAELNDREVLCFVFDPSGDLVGSVKGAAR